MGSAYFMQISHISNNGIYSNLGIRSLYHIQKHLIKFGLHRIIKTRKLRKNVFFEHPKKIEMHLHSQNSRVQRAKTMLSRREGWTNIIFSD